jgi:hypothetical protein
LKFPDIPAAGGVATGVKADFHNVYGHFLSVAGDFLYVNADFSAVSGGFPAACTTKKLSRDHMED